MRPIFAISKKTRGVGKIEYFVEHHDIVENEARSSRHLFMKTRGVGETEKFAENHDIVEKEARNSCSLRYHFSLQELLGWQSS